MNYDRSVTAAKRKTPAKAPAKHEVINAGKLEAEGLETLKLYLGYVLDTFKQIEKGTAERVTSYMVDENVAEKDVPEKYYYPDPGYVEEVGDTLEKGIRYLLEKLQKAEEVTQETALTEAVETFWKQFNHYVDVREDTKSVEKAKPHFEKARELAPLSLPGPGSLAKLQKCFDEIALGANLLFDEKSIKAPKIPKALEPDDPRQLGFGFTASASSVVTRYLNNK